jgi:hypothetical protein
MIDGGMGLPVMSREFRVEVGYPNRPDAARIMDALIGGLPGRPGRRHRGGGWAAAQAHQRQRLREIIRRAVLAAQDGHVSTATLLAEVGIGRYRPAIPEGMCL